MPERRVPACVRTSTGQANSLNIFIMPEEGVEPSRSKLHTPLKRARIPISPFRRVGVGFQLTFPNKIRKLKLSSASSFSETKYDFVSVSSSFSSEMMHFLGDCPKMSLIFLSFPRRRESTKDSSPANSFYLQ